VFAAVKFQIFIISEKVGIAETIIGIGVNVQLDLFPESMKHIFGNNIRHCLFSKNGLIVNIDAALIVPGANHKLDIIINGRIVTVNSVV
jgi:hypothetical protein